MPLELWGSSTRLVTRGEFYIGCGPEEPVTSCTEGELECNLVILRDSHGTRALFVSLDTLYVGPGLRRQIEKELSDEFDPSQIVLGASHSHNSPMTDETKPGLGLVHAEFVSQIVRQVTDSVRRLIESEPTVVGLDVRKFVTSSAVYRRKRGLVARSKFGIRLFPILLLPNYRKRIRPESNILEFRDSEGLIVGTIWVMPCHPVAHPASGEVSSHYIGEVRRRSREDGGSSNHAPFVFFQGASGDLRPAFSYRSSRQSRLFSWLELFRPDTDMASASRFDYYQWCSELFSEFTGAQILESQKSGEEIALSNPRLIRRPLQEFLERTRSDSEGFFDLHLISVGGVRLAGLSAEPTWMARRALAAGLEPLVVFGCINDTYGYLPSPKQLFEGGYEAGGFLSPFGLKSGIKWRFGLYRIFRHTRKVLSKSFVSEL